MTIATGIISKSLVALGEAIMPPPFMSFREFIAEAWKVTEPGKHFYPNWHIDLIAEYLEAVSAGEILRLIINIPPRWSKSTLVTIDWPCWEWGPLGRPELRYMFVSYDQKLSTAHSLARRRVIQSAFYQKHWGKRVILCGDQNLKTQSENTRRGMMLSTSTHGGATGQGGDRLMFDDFLNPSMAESDAERATALEQYGGTFSSRLDDKRKGAIVVVEQRLHVNDFTAARLKEGGWTHLSIPSDNDTKEPLRFSFPKSKREVTLEPGAATWPEREPLDVIAKDRIAKGPRTHDAQCRQRPSADQGNIFKRGKWRFYTELPFDLNEKGQKVPKRWDELIQSWDCSFKDESTSDFVVGQVWGKLAADRYLLDQFKDRVALPGTIEAILSMSQRWPNALRKLIEDKANGPAVIQMLDRRLVGLEAVNPQGGKIVRARAVEPIQCSGNIWLPSPELCPWILDFIETCANFPQVAHDDEVDAMTQANVYFTGDGTPTLTVL